MRLPDALTKPPSPAAAPDAATPGERRAAPPPPAPPPPASPPAPRPFLRAFRRALTDHRTYDLRANPALWLGFLLASPMPFLAFAASAPAWILLIAIPSPALWAVVLGAAGRVGFLAEEEATRLARVAEEAHRQVRTSEQALARESARREDLEQQANVVFSDLRLAQAVHATLLPANVARPDVEVAVRQIPCQFVGGDYLHASVVEERWLYLCVADVSGHGVAAALVVARVHGLVRRLTLEKRLPEAILEELNRAALAILKHTYFFMTFGVFRLDLRDGTLEYATAGHPGQVLLRADGRTEVLRTPNRLLGMDPDIFDADRPSATTRLAPGDTVVLFTDGLFEILGGESGDEMLGEKELLKRIESVRTLSPSLMAGEVLQDLADYQGSSAFEDDVSLLIARYKEPVAATSRP